VGGLQTPVVLVWLDCVAGDLFVEMYKKGYLENLVEIFEEGFFVENAVSCFPTVSEAAEGGIISGFFSGETNMVGERYFSRKQQRIKHYKFNARAEKDFNPKLRRKTLDAIIENSVAMGRIIHISEEVVDLIATRYEREGSLKIVERRIEIASKIAAEKKPNMLFFTISADYISHVYGRRSNMVKRFIKRFDELFPYLIEALDEAYGNGNYLLFVFSDHGSANVSKHLDLPAFLSEEGFNPAIPDLLIERRETNSAALSNGRRIGLLYFAHPEYGWRRRPGYKVLRNYPGKGDLLKLLVQEEGIEQAFARKDRRSVVVVSREGEGIIEYDSRSDKYRYRVVSGSDPLNYEIESRWMSEEEWLKATYDKEYPDAVVQIYNIFKTENCGDIVLNAASGWDFWEPWDIPYPELKASHGGLSRDEMVTFILAKGPKIRKSEIGYSRLIDIFATIAACYNMREIAADSHATERMLKQ